MSDLSSRWYRTTDPDATRALGQALGALRACDTAAIVFPREGVGIDSIYYGAPEDIGHVNMDDWTDDVNALIDEI